MGPSSKVRTKPVSLSVPASPALYERLDRHRKETGVPIAQFAIRALKRALDEVDAKAARKTRATTT